MRLQSTAVAEPRLLVINPNSNATVTARIRQAAEDVVARQTRVTVVNPVDGPYSIEMPDDRVQAVPRIMELIRDGAVEGYDAYVLACFDDMALTEARALVDVPVVGAFEAGIAAIRTVAARFSIVTTVHSAVPGILDLLNDYGAAGLCTVRAAGIGVAAAAGEEEFAEKKITQCIRAAIEEDGADAILLGSGALAGRAASYRRVFPVPVVDPVVAAVKMAEGLMQLQLGAQSEKFSAA